MGNENEWGKAMELNELKTTMDTHGELRHYYVFWCEDRSMADVYIAQMCQAYGLAKAPRATVAEAIREANAPSLFEGASTLYVVRDDEAFAKDEKGWKALTEVERNVVVAIYTADKKTVFANATDAVLFKKADKQVLANCVIAATYGISQQRALWLAEACDCLYGLCLLECEKVVGLAREMGIGVDGAFDALASQGQLGLDKENGAFTFVNSFVLGDAEGTFGALDGSDPLGYLGLMYMQCKSMYMVSANASSKNICADTGLTFNQVNAYRHKRHTIRPESLPYVMALTQRVESGIKLGKIPMEFALRYLLANCWDLASGKSV